VIRRKTTEPSKPVMMILVGWGIPDRELEGRMFIDPAARPTEHQMELIVGRAYTTALTYNPDSHTWHSRKGGRHTVRPELTVATEEQWSKALLLHIANLADVMEIDL
jgi:hypothetical protein